MKDDVIKKRLIRFMEKPNDPHTGHSLARLPKDLVDTRIAQATLVRYVCVCVCAYGFAHACPPMCVRACVNMWGVRRAGHEVQHMMYQLRTVFSVLLVALN